MLVLLVSFAILYVCKSPGRWRLKWVKYISFAVHLKKYAKNLDTDANGTFV